MANEGQHRSYPEVIRAFLAFPYQRKRIGQLLCSKKALLIVLMGIIGWQSVYYHHPEYISQEEKRTDAGGFTHWRAKHFFYFYYHLSLFPVLTTVEEKEDSKVAANAIIERQGETLMMEYGHWSRLGESGRIWAFLPNAWVKGAAEAPSIRLFNAIFFVLGLLSLYYGSWRIGLPLFGLFTVLFLGASPFHLYETYVNENIFALPTAVCMLLLGLYLPFIFARQTRGIWLLLIFSGVLVATASNIRAENLPVLASCVMVVAFLSSFSMLRRFMMVVVILFIYYLTNQGIRSYFDMKFEEAVEVVESAGGHPYYGGRIESHRFWHPVFCGLGDFDKKYGYEWNDIVAYNYAIPILERDYGLTLNYSGDKYYLDEYYDEAKHYYKKFDEIDEYEEVMKQKVMGDIKSDPGWYIDILFKRVNRILTNTAPIHAHFTLKGMGWLLLPLLLILIWVKEWRFAQLVVFALPLVASSILIYSGGNSTYSSPYHFVLLGLLLAMLIEFLLMLKAKPNPKAPME